MYRSIGVAILAGAVALALGPSPEAWAIDGVEYCPATGHWYKLYVTNYARFHWKSCETLAMGAGGYLACVGSATENKWLVDRGFTSGGHSGRAFVGGTDEVQEGTWRWVSGEPWSYTNWGPGEPDAANSRHDFLRLERDGTWSDVDGTGTEVYGYIVEWDEDPNVPPPPPPPGTADLVVLGVGLSPPSPAPGDSVEASFTARNAGAASGPITARLGLEGHDGAPLAERTLAGLLPGATVTETLSGRIPTDLPPGEYHATILLAAEGESDANPADNLGRAPRAFRVERPPIALVPGKYEGTLGPLGRQVFLLDAFPELRAKLRVKLKKGGGTKRLERAEDGALVAGAEGDAKLACALTGIDGPHELLVESDMGRTTRYRLKLKAKRIRRAGEIEVGPEPVELGIPGFPGMTAKLELKGLDGLVPALDAGDLGPGATVKVRGTKTKAKGLALEGEGPWTVRVSAAGAAAGRCGYEIRVK